MSYLYLWILLLCALLTVPTFTIDYSARLVGVDDPAIEQAMISASPVLQHAAREVSSVHSLKVQAQSELAILQNIASYYGFFDCKLWVETRESPTLQVDLHVNLGKQFLFQDLVIKWADEDLVINQYREGLFSQETLHRPTSADLTSFHKNQRATGKKIAQLTDELVDSLRKHGYAFAKILDREIIASRKEATVTIKIDLQTGPMICFGETKILGNRRVLPEFFIANTEWKRGALYNPKYLQRTEKNLKESGLFLTVQVEESDEISSDWTVPINIIVTENKPRTISAGGSYTSTYGGGITGLWEHRNVTGCGEKVTTKLELWQKMRTALFSLTIPDFKTRQQDLLWIVEYDQQSYMPFTSQSVKGSILLDKQLTRKSNTVFGLSMERLESTGIIGHKLYRLCKLPLQYKWSNANHLLDPTSGNALHLRLTPSWQIVSPHYTYLIQNTTLASYRSFFEDKLTLAARAGVGNIFGALHKTIPLPDKFFGGSDSSLRGYKTGSVSPKNHHGKLKGGRSIATLSLEARLRQSNGLGYVAFFDTGQVFRQSVPTFRGEHLLMSVGCGIRYATPIGPLRLDLAFPLQRRDKIDPPFQIYFSIGQAF